jgi:hypothetical protein
MGSDTCCNPVMAGPPDHLDPHQFANDAIPFREHSMEMTGSSPVMTGVAVRAMTEVAARAMTEAARDGVGEACRDEVGVRIKPMLAQTPAL